MENKGSEYREGERIECDYVDELHLKLIRDTLLRLRGPYMGNPSLSQQSMYFWQIGGQRADYSPDPTNFGNTILIKRNRVMLNPAAADVWLFLGARHYNRQDWNQACKLFERAWISDNDVDAAALFLSKALGRAGDPKKASLAIHRHLEPRPPSAPLLVQLGYTQHRN